MGSSPHTGHRQGTHCAPPNDAASDNIQPGKRIADTAASSGLVFEMVERRSVGAEGNAVRQLLQQMWFDELRCADGLEVLARYKCEWNPDLQAFSMKPEHSRDSDAADALRSFAVGYRDAGEFAHSSPPPPSQWYFNPLTYGKR